MKKSYKAIVFESIGAFNDHNEWAIVCESENVDACIEREKHLCSEIVSYKVMNAFLKLDSE